MAEFGDWFSSIPFITRSWFAASVAVPLIGKLGLVDFRTLMLFPELFINRFHLWRPVTATFFFPLTPGTGFLFLVNLYFLYHYSSRLETGVFDGRPADYVFMLLFNWLCIVIVGLLMNMRLLMIPLIMSVLYVWAHFHKDTIVSFWFGTRFKAHYLPWVILVFNFIIGGSFMDELTGNLVGHLYYFMVYKYPVDLGGRSFLSTPEILYRYFPTRRAGVAGFGMAPTRRPVAQEQAGGGGGGGGGGAAAGRGGRHNWGQGFRLGGE